MNEFLNPDNFRKDDDRLPENILPRVDPLLNEPHHYTYVDKPEKISEFILNEREKNPEAKANNYDISNPSDSFKAWLDSFWEEQEPSIRENTSRGKWEMEIKRHIIRIMMHLDMPRSSDHFSKN